MHAVVDFDMGRQESGKFHVIITYDHMLIICMPALVGP